MSNTNDEKKYPSLVTGVYIFNNSNELFLVRAPHWSNKFVIPGGHVEYGESFVDTAKREVKEETGLDINNIEFLEPVEIKDSDDYKKKKHIVSLSVRAELIDSKQEVILDKREGTEYIWIKPKDALKLNDLEKTVKKTIENFFIKKSSKKKFSKKNKDCEKVEKKLEEYKQGWQRAQADYKNLQKEISEQRGEWARMSEQTILEEFIPVYDNFKKAFAMDHGGESEKIKNWAKGIEYIMKQFSKILENHGVVEIKTVGELFNPELHETVGEEAGEEEHGRILKEVDGGYKMGNKVIKVAKVIIAK